jgi:hypothetical protein
MHASQQCKLVDFNFNAKYEVREYSHVHKVTIYESHIRACLCSFCCVCFWTRLQDEFADFHDYGAPLNDDSWPSLAARHIEGSPFALTVSPAPTFARRSKLYRSTGGAPPKAFDFTNWHVGTVQTFTLEAHDAFDNLRLVRTRQNEVGLILSVSSKSLI